MVWAIVFFVLILVLGYLMQSSPSARLWADKRPGKPGAVDPTGRPVPEQAEFKKPPDEGNLL
jgi:preprotein translocase subunit SecG